MTKRKRKQSNMGLYILILLCLITSGTAIWGAVNKLESHQENASAYETLKGEVLAELTPEEEQAQSFLEEEIPSQGLEEQEADQEQVMRLIRTDQASSRFFEEPEPTGQGPATPQPTARETKAPVAQEGAIPEETAHVNAMATAAPTPSVTAASQDVAMPASRDTAALDEDFQAARETPKLSSGAPGTSLSSIPSASQASMPVKSPTSTQAPMDASPLEPISTAGPAASVPIVTNTPSPSPTPAPTPEPTEEPVRLRAVDLDRMRYTLNFEHLKTVNPEIVAWLLQEGTAINYPVLQGENNDVYLNRMFNNRQSDEGSLFMDSGNKRTFTDANTYIYGHNTKVGSMFASLPNYANQEYYEQHPQMILLTPHSDFIIDLFACTFSLVEDEAAWRVKQFRRKAEFEAYLKDLKEKSLFKSDVTPEWGDQWLVLCTCTNIRHGQRYVVYGRMRPIRYTSKERVDLTKKNMDLRPTQNGPVGLAGLGERMVYAQNDELWAGFRFEAPGTGKKRSFGDGGAGPTAVAMAVANLVAPEDLGRISGYAKEQAGFTFCTCSVNQYYCNKLHAQYRIETPEEYARYLPMAIASFAAGNNQWEENCRTANSGTSIRFIEYIAGIYGLKLETSLSISDALPAVRQGAMAVCATDKSNAFAKGSHYVVLAGMDEQYLYVLDPFRRDGYKAADREGLVELLAPNVTRVRLDATDRLGLNAFYILRKAEP